jgi:hypothetical protein
MIINEILIAIITGLIANECYDLSPRVARKIVRWSAHRQYLLPDQAETQAKKLDVDIKNGPGNLFKLITALGFAARAATRKIVFNASPPDPLWWPTTPKIRVYRDLKIYFPGSEIQDRISAVRQAWQQLSDQVRDAAKEVGMGSRS